MLKEGNTKFKLCVVGTFTKGTTSLNKVIDFARAAWTKRGLVNVSQKDNKTFIFRFATAVDMNSVLARGT